MRQINSQTRKGTWRGGVQLVSQSLCYIENPSVGWLLPHATKHTQTEEMGSRLSMCAYMNVPIKRGLWDSINLTLWRRQLGRLVASSVLTYWDESICLLYWETSLMQQLRHVGNI